MARLTETSRSASCWSRVEAEQVLDADLIDPDAPQVEQPETDEKNGEGASSEGLRDQPSHRRFTVGRNM